MFRHLVHMCLHHRIIHDNIEVEINKYVLQYRVFYKWRLPQ